MREHTWGSGRGGCKLTPGGRPPQRSVHELPHKTTIYSTLVGLINARNFDFGQMIIHYLTTVIFQTALNASDFVKVRILVCARASLRKCPCTLNSFNTTSAQ